MTTPTPAEQFAEWFTPLMDAEPFDPTTPQTADANQALENPTEQGNPK